MTHGASSSKASQQSGLARFGNLLFGGSLQRACYDEVLLEVQDCVVAPTRGSIVPNWLLVVPRRSAVSFRRWRTTTLVDPTWLVGEILTYLRIGAERAIWFEHGPIGDGSLVGCGIDYAHLHILIDAPFSFEQLAVSAVENAPVDWRRISSREAYDTISTESSYLVLGSLHKALLAENVDGVGSQFFRRVIAALVSKPHEWDYKTHAHVENVLATVSTFNSWRALAEAS